MSFLQGRMAARGARAYRQAVDGLFSRLGIEPEPAGGSAEVLTLDGIEISLEQTASEDALRMTAQIGLLSEDRLRRLEQMRAILKRNLLHLRDFGACCSLEETEDRRLLLLLQVRQAYAGLRQEQLAERLNELVSLAEIYRDLIEASPRQVAGSVADESGHIIFKP